VSIDRVLVVATLVFTAIGAMAGVVAFFFPPDPSHPAHLDFLSRTVALPIWLAVVLCAGVAVAIAFVWLRLRDCPAGSRGLALAATPVETAAAMVAPQRVVRQSVAQVRAAFGMGTPAVVPVPQPLGEAGHKERSFSSEAGFSVRVRQEEHGVAKGLMLQVQNDRLDSIAGISISIHSARSYDARLKDFRDGHGFAGVRVEQPELIRAGFPGRNAWLVAKDVGRTPLFVGGNANALLEWPRLDSSDVQKWLLSVSVLANSAPRNAATPAEKLAPIEFQVMVAWDTRTNEFSLLGD
jgi:hypothetical protein